jgi:hypothetical protein
MATKRRHTNNFKKKRRGNKRTAKNMKGGVSKPVCKNLSQLGDKNIFQIFKSSIQLPKIMSR